MYQRPQHLLSRAAQQHRIFFWEEPVVDLPIDAKPALELLPRQSIVVVRPHLPQQGDAIAQQRQLLDKFLVQQNISSMVRWYYTPMALEFSRHLHASATVYDCMDELNAFLGAPPTLVALEQELFQTADVVFTGGISLYEVKRLQHANVHAFPSSIDVDHFARQPAAEPVEQSGIPHPRAGFFGVLDERFDHTLIRDVARLRPEVHFVLIGPVVKIDPATLPHAANIHYLGARSYDVLPDFLAHWDVALIPFARNASTQFISPTKTPEYLAAGKPVVSTSIRDVVRSYGATHLVAIADDPEHFAAAMDVALQPPTSAWRAAVADKLGSGSWDRTWCSMWAEVKKVLGTADSRSHALLVQPVTRPAVASTRKARMAYDYVIVGAGFAGSVLAERLASGMGRRVLLIDKRDHIGGNAFDHTDKAGLLVHRYGPHIFHTNHREVFEYLSRFTEWHSYTHRVLASVDGKLVPIPINLDTINALYGLDLDAAGMQAFLEQRVSHKALIRTSEDIVISRVGQELYEKFFRNYTRKQWGLDPSQLDSSVAGRIPVRFDRDDRYFADRYQAMPKFGYTRMFERMLDHPGIEVQTSTEFSDVASFVRNATLIYTGPIDEFFGHRFGPLPYRSLSFRHETLAQESFQSAPVVNYPNEHEYTRITEFKKLTGQVGPATSVVYEYPKAEGDPYYPIPRPENAALYARYKQLADRRSDVVFVGRLANYRYYNMDQVVAQALLTARSIAGQTTAPESTQAPARGANLVESYASSPTSGVESVDSSTVGSA